jgi:uncharacterized protein YecE (DUF72 family)
MKAVGGVFPPFDLRVRAIAHRNLFVHESTSHVTGGVLRARPRRRSMSAMPSHFVGTSGFASPLSRTTLGSPRASVPALLTGYADRLGALEMDSSFYRSPSPDTVHMWRDATSGRVTFTVRMARDATHVERLGAPARVARFLDSLAPLGDTLGCILFTTPPSLACDTELVRTVLDVVPSGIRTAWEFRHPSWDSPDVVEQLVRRGSAPAIVETLDGVCGEHLVEAKWELPFIYVRMRKGRYRARELVMWGNMLADTGKDVFVFFRQSPEAVAYAAALAEVLSEPAPRATL